MEGGVLCDKLIRFAFFGFNQIDQLIVKSKCEVASKSCCEGTEKSQIYLYIRIERAGRRW